MAPRKMYNCWVRAAQYVPADADIVAFGGVVYGLTAIPNLPQCVNVPVILTIGQDTSATLGWLHPIQDCEVNSAHSFLTPLTAAQNIGKRQAAGSGWGTVYNELATLPALRSAMGTLNYWLWLRKFQSAQPQSPVAGEVACQWRSVPGLPAAAEDLGGVQESAVFDPNWAILYR
jgi:hypothetical protein